MTKGAHLRVRPFRMVCRFFVTYEKTYIFCAAGEPCGGARSGNSRAAAAVAAFIRGRHNLCRNREAYRWKNGRCTRA